MNNSTNEIQSGPVITFNKWLNQYFQAHPQLTTHKFPVFTTSTAIIWLVSLLTFLFAFFGLCFYIKVSLIIFKKKTATFSNAFYTFVLYLAVPDCLFLLVQIFGCFITVVGFYNVHVYIVIVVGFLGQVASWSLFALIAALGVNRYIGVCHPHIYKLWFGKTQAHVVGCLCWLLGFLLPIVDYYCTCYSFKSDLSWKFSCAAVAGASLINLAIRFDQTVSIFFTCFVPVINIITFCHYRVAKYRVSRSMNQEMKIDKNDLKMLLQFIVISTVFVSYMIIYWIQDLQKTGPTADVILTFLAILNSSVNPYLYASFNQEIRAQLYTKKSSQVASSTATQRSIL